MTTVQFKVIHFLRQIRTATVPHSTSQFSEKLDMKLRKKKERDALAAIERAKLTVVGDAAIATVGVANGRLAPLLIVNKTERPDIVELIRAHKHLPPGDVESQWAQLKNYPDRVHLFLRFLKPIETDVVLEFDILTQGSLADLVMRARLFWLQAGLPGDRLITTMDTDKILIDVPESGFDSAWDGLMIERLTRFFRSKGLSKEAAKIAASTHIADWRNLEKLRVNDDVT